jgi:hypothetical protein
VEETDVVRKVLPQELDLEFLERVRRLEEELGSRARYAGRAAIRQLKASV